MTLPLRTVAVVVALLASGFPAGHLATHGRAASPATAANTLPAVPADSLPKPLPATPASLGARLPMGPVQGPVSSPFGPRRHPVSGRARHHDGVDLAVPAGTAVWTVAPGTVRAVGRRPGYGLVVEIEHPAGLGRPVRTVYAHLASVDAGLRAGVRVGRGVAIGASGGRPGRDGVSTGAHLHFEVRDAGGRPLDPARFVRLAASAHAAPRWRSSGASASGARPPGPEPPAPQAVDAPSDSLAATGDDLPDLVLPDYPALPALRDTPQP